MLRYHRLPLLRPVARRMLFHTRQSGRLFQEVKQTVASSAKPEGKPVAPKGGIKQLMSKYGYSALGIYLGFSFIDLPLSFLLVHSAGSDKIEELQGTVMGWFGYTSDPVENAPLESAPVENAPVENAPVETEQPTEGWRSYVSPTLLTEFGIAYALHKSLIVIRLPLTAAVTPSVVAMLQRWGFKIGNKAVTTAVK